MIAQNLRPLIPDSLLHVATPRLIDVDRDARCLSPLGRAPVLSRLLNMYDRLQ
jgi:hypothetical protein